ncbi:DNA glycosylase AlkZ-like family protein [Nocardia sp. NPDC055029]
MAARKCTAEIGEVIGFRLRAHHLTARRPADDLLAVAGACGIQNSPPGSALSALHARVEDVTAERVDHLVGEEKSLLQTWCMRGSPYFFPTADAPVFTTGVLPTTETARRHLIRGIGQALDTLGMGLDEVVDRTAAQLGPVLSRRAMAITELGEELAARIADTLPPAQRTHWRAAGPYGANQPLGEAVVHFCLRIHTLRGLVCLAPRVKNTAPFVLLGDWLGTPLPHTDPAATRATLLRRYLRCYGPSTRKDFAAWLGIDAGDVDPWWTGVADELTPVEFGGGCCGIARRHGRPRRVRRVRSGLRRGPLEQASGGRDAHRRRSWQGQWSPTGYEGRFRTALESTVSITSDLIGAHDTGDSRDYA